jgi:hypothetical protein
MFCGVALRRLRVPWWLVLLVGCGRGETPPDRYVPSPATARHALEAALKAWQNGQPAGQIENPGVAIWMVDTHRRPGQKLERFTILGETPGDGPRCLAARLFLEAPPDELRARFVIMGIDPLWVYRYEDFEMMMHWECGLEERVSIPRPAPKQ